MNKSTSNAKTPDGSTRSRAVTILGRVALAATAFGLVAPMALAVGTPAGTNITNTATAAYADGNGNAFNATSNTVTTTVNQVCSVTVSAPANASGGSNTVVNYAYTLTNMGNGTETFALTAASGAGGNSWSVTLFADDGAGGGTANDGIRQGGETNVTASSGAVVADGTYKFFAAVSIPADTVDGQTDDTTTTVTGTCSVVASDSVTTTASAATVVLVKSVRNVTQAGSFGASATGDPGDVLEYRITVDNTGTQDATTVVVTDPLSAFTTFVAASLTCNGAGRTDSAADDEADPCSGSFSSPNVTFAVGTGSAGTTGGTVTVADSVITLTFRVTIN